MMRTSNTNTRTLRLCVRFKSTFPFIAVSNRFSRCLDKAIVASFDRCLNLFQSITRHWGNGAKLFCI